MGQKRFLEELKAFDRLIDLHLRVLVLDGEGRDG
jgi:hypothetical protein